MSKAKSYIDIGHQTNEGVWVWLYGPPLTALKAAAGNHEQIWGMDAMNYWRGRYVEKDHEASVIAPINWRFPGHIPQAIFDALESKFGGDIVYTAFNPQGKIETGMVQNKRMIKYARKR